MHFRAFEGGHRQCCQHASKGVAQTHPTAHRAGSKETKKLSKTMVNRPHDEKRPVVVPCFMVRWVAPGCLIRTLPLLLFKSVPASFAWKFRGSDNNHASDTKFHASYVLYQLLALYRLFVLFRLDDVLKRPCCT
jgi:hypothetical protein